MLLAAQQSLQNACSWFTLRNLPIYTAFSSMTDFVLPIFCDVLKTRPSELFIAPKLHIHIIVLSPNCFCPNIG